jgi:hypothetical protein
VPITRDFEIASPGEQSDEHVRRYYREVVGRDRLEGVFSQDRFEKMLALPRSNWQKGKASFYGYIVLMFDHTERVLLECPVEDNAIYLLDSGEDGLLKMNKRQLRESGEAKRIFHRGDLYQRLKDELGIERPPSWVVPALAIASPQRYLNLRLLPHRSPEPDL